MSMDIEFANLDSRDVFAWFEKIAKIPHGSKNEKALSDFLVHYAKDKGFEATQDALWNVVIKKPASSAALANKSAVILQSHMDMVCNKEEGYAFDFERDPITLVVEKDADGDSWLRSDRTTLGADDGIGIAYSMALLDSTTIAHPPLEIVITTQEEVGMNGASALDVGPLKGKTLINIDSEEEGIFCTSCCSGMSISLAMPAKKREFSSIDNASDYAFFTIEVSGLMGGHSGIEIDKERGNANRLLGRVLVDVAKHYSCYLAAIEGGIAHNAIPSSANATVCVAKKDADTIAQCVASWKTVFTNELRNSDTKDGAEIRVQITPAPLAKMIYADDTCNLALTAMTLLPHGVATRDIAQKIPQTSSNFATIAMQDNAIVFTASIRSLFISKRDFIESQIRSIAAIIGAEVTTEGVYPAWEYASNSPIREVFQKAYENTYGKGKNAKLEGIHAGLECGIFFAKFAEKGQKLDMFAFGPTVLGAHTPTERVNIASVDRTWKLLVEALKILSA